MEFNFPIHFKERYFTCLYSNIILSINDKEEEMIKKKNLYILTESYPYDCAEKTFIEPELQILLECDKFNITIISNAACTQELTSPILSMVSYENIMLIPAYRNPLFCIKSLILYLISKDNRTEIEEIFREKEKKCHKLISSFRYYLRAKIYLEQIIKLRLDIENALFYTYWFDEKALAISLLKKEKNFKFVSRIHGYDLYNERTLCNRQAFRYLMDQRCDKLFFISEVGRKYFEKEFGKKFSRKHELQRLGVFCELGYEEIIQKQKESEVFLLVSCSSIIPIKRVDYIVDALNEIHDINVKWIHFGAGCCYESVKEKAYRLLANKQNIDYIFAGHTENKKIQRFYLENKVDAFITTSETEGAPVSIQEAMAYGIPIIATAVGEIPFMVEGNGVIFDKNAMPKDVAQAIVYLYGLPEEQKQMMRDRARKKWEVYYDGKKNYQSFCSELEELVQEGENN